MTGRIKIQVLCNIFLKIVIHAMQMPVRLRENILHKQRTACSLEDFLCQWHLYLLSVTSLFNIFIWRPINKKRRPRLGRNPSKFNLCVHKALHLSKWHFPISAFDSIDFFLPSSLRPLSMHGWNNKGSWVDFFCLNWALWRIVLSDCRNRKMVYLTSLLCIDCNYHNSTRDREGTEQIKEMNEHAFS